MVNNLTKDGKCPKCTYGIIRQDKDSIKVLFVAIKSMRINKIDGSTTIVCPRCKKIVDMPEIKIKREIMDNLNATDLHRKNY